MSSEFHRRVVERITPEERADMVEFIDRLPAPMRLERILYFISYFGLLLLYFIPICVISMASLIVMMAANYDMTQSRFVQWFISPLVCMENKRY